jgi:hypothetical protein
MYIKTGRINTKSFFYFCFQDGSKGRFNAAHMRTRNIVERAFGVVKNRFYALSTGLRVPDMEMASKLIICAMILHNLSIEFGDNGDEPDQEDDDGDQQPQQAEAGPGPARDKRRNQLLTFFS